MIYYYVNAINGVDEVTAGTLAKPFKTLDYCITQIHTRNIKKLKLEDEEQALFLLNSDIETLDEAIENEREKYLSDIIARAYEDDITVYLSNGEYDLNNKLIFDGLANKSITVIGNGITTTVFNQISFENSSYGTEKFNVIFKRFIWDNSRNQSTTPNILLSNTGLSFENILFLNIPNNEYSFFGSYENLILKNCVKPKKSTGFFRNYESKYSAITGTYGYITLGYYSSFEKLNLNKNNIFLDTEEIQLDENFNITDPNIDIAKIGLYAGEYTWAEQDCLIKMNNKYYSINEEFWNTETKQFNDIGSLDFEKSFHLSLLTKETTYGVDTFIPLDKFDNFSIVFKDDKIKKLDINGFKLANITVITNPIDLRMVESFNNITINGNNVKCLFKINDEEQWYGYNFEENTIQNEDITNISINGIEISNVKNIDFNKIKEDREGDLSKITFSFYLEQNSIINNIEIDYLEVGEYTQKDAATTKLKVGYKKITIQPSFNAQILKINVLWV